MKSITTMSAAMLLLVATSVANAGDVDDTVVLSNGGRVRGTIMEEDPKQGVAIKLLDGTLRKIKASEVKTVEYGKKAEAAPPATTSAPPTAAPAPPPQAAPPVVQVIQLPPPEPRKKSHRRSTALFVTGLVLMPLGALALGAGFVFEAVKPPKDPPQPGVPMFVGGGVGLATGLVFTIVGGGHTGGEEEARALPVRPYVGPRGFGFTGAF